jgi:hypothetical protein
VKETKVFISDSNRRSSASGFTFHPMEWRA